eukprot:669017-Rhodomonas_salina.2
MLRAGTVNSAIRLRACYAMFGTDAAHQRSLSMPMTRPQLETAESRCVLSLSSYAAAMPCRVPAWLIVPITLFCWRVRY